MNSIIFQHYNSFLTINNLNIKFNKSNIIYNKTFLNIICNINNSNFFINIDKPLIKENKKFEIFYLLNNSCISLFINESLNYNNNNNYIKYKLFIYISSIIIIIILIFSIIFYLNNSKKLNNNNNNNISDASNLIFENSSNIEIIDPITLLINSNIN